MANLPIVYDVVIIGGGINGCGCAADAAMRGLSVLLCEQGDLASKTSSSSSKLIHGGLRYLEQFEFGMVKKALTERQTLMQLAPHLIHPLPLVLPHEKSMRPLWFLRLGLFLYDHLSRKNTLPHSRFIRRLYDKILFAPLIETIQNGFVFYDCATDDARLTMENALQAKKHGANILTQTTLIEASNSHDQWQLTLQTRMGECFQVFAKSVINAAGPWVETVNKQLNIPLDHSLSLIKGSHILVHKLYEGDHAYLLQNKDNRIVFVVPYHGYTMIGTTDMALTQELDDLCIEKTEIEYLFDLVNQYFNTHLKTQDIVNSWTGVRPLVSSKMKNPSTLSREYAYFFSKTPAPSVTIYSGKITTYRQLALEAINQLKDIFPNLPDSKTKLTPLPGAAWRELTFQAYQAYAIDKYHWLDEDTLVRYLKNYGTRTESLLMHCHSIPDLGICFTETLYQVEVDYLIQEEWATSCEDILWRRTKLGLNINTDAVTALSDYVKLRVSSPII